MPTPNPGHSRWDRIRAKPSSDPGLHREQVAYTRGYLLALDDMLKDLEEYRSTIPDGRGLGDPHRVLLGFHDVILKTRRQALHTEMVLLLAYQDKEVPHGQVVQAPASEAEEPRPGAGSTQQGAELPEAVEQTETSPRPASESRRGTQAQNWKQVYEQEDWE